MNRVLFAVVTASLLTACDTILGDGHGRSLRVTTLEDMIVAGASAEVRLENLSNRTIGFNLCPRILERRSDGSWTPLPETRPPVCTAQLYHLEPDKEFVQPVLIPSGLALGTYRILFEEIFFDPGSRDLPSDERTTNAFELVGPETPE